MSLRIVLFDLDGTLLPMDQDVFIQRYFKGLCEKLVPHGYDAKALIKGVWTGTQAMIENDGSRTNEEVFWDCFANIFGEAVRQDLPLFDEFYRTRFDDVKEVCGYTPKAAELIHEIKEMGLRTVLATNPIFPAVATRCRMKWAGLEETDFEHFTTYENSTFCKPNPRYYEEILNKIGAKPEECLMVGNDAREDTAAQALGMKVFLLTDCLINKDHADISQWPNGSFEALADYIRTLIV